jgi:spore maturation protein CgeB
MMKVFNSAKIVLNIHVEDDLPYKVNMRTFEATGCGTFLLTDYAYGIDEVFKVGEELIVYNDEDELIELVKYYLNSEEKRREISSKAQKRAYEEHTYNQRIASLISIMK